MTAETHEYDVAANWKVIVENYQECYHCSMIHPELCRVEPADERREPRAATATGSAAGWTCAHGAETMSLDGRSGGVAMARLDEHELRTVMYVAVLPNLLISLHPDYVMTHLLTPLAPRPHARSRARGRSRARWPRSAGFDPSYAVDFWDLTNRQDWAACESVQRGMTAPALRARPAGARGGRRLPVRPDREAYLVGRPGPAEICCLR